MELLWSIAKRQSLTYIDRYCSNVKVYIPKPLITKKGGSSFFYLIWYNRAILLILEY